jgi:hypothetical protein
MTLRISKPADEGVYQASKWLKYQILLDAEELGSLFRALGQFWIFPMTGIVNGKPTSHDFFIAEYGRWIEGLKNGIIPSAEMFRRLLACVFVDDLEALWLQEVSPGQFLTKIQKPVVQVQAHYFSYSSVDEVFRPMSMGKESIFWGLQFSFPQIYQDPKTMELLDAKEGFLFRKIQIWAREASRATPFLVGGKKTNVPIRLGRQCFSWINCHPQLREQQIQVATAS